MRFNNNKTCIEFLENGINCDFYIANDWPIARKELFKEEIKRSFLTHKNEFASRIQYITDPFYKAYQATSDKVIEALKTESLGRVAGTFIIPCNDGIVKTAFYGIEQKENGKFDSIYIEFTRSREDNITACGAAIQMDASSETVNYYVGDGYKMYNTDGKMVLAEFILLCGFLKYCTIETKIIKPGEKFRNEYKVKYFNETKNNIEILDSTWFTNIVRHEGFKVRGHLRLQPYGPSLSKKKWIYIAPFDKEGYSINAKKHE